VKAKSESARVATIGAVVNSLNEAREVAGLSKADLARSRGPTRQRSDGRRDRQLQRLVSTRGAITSVLGQARTPDEHRQHRSVDQLVPRQRRLLDPPQRLRVAVHLRRRDLGYGPTTLGTENHSVHIWLTGSQTWSDDVEYNNSVSTQNVIVSRNLINAAPGAVAQEVPGKFSLYNLGNTTGGHWYKWQPNGYKSYDYTMWDHSQVHQFSWKKSGYAGYWYTYVKSISSHTTQRNIPGATYRYRCCSEAEEMPAAWYRAGWRS